MNYSKDALLEFNSIFKENNDLYRVAAKSFGISLSVFWVLYFLREDSEIHTQKDICYASFLPKQTINSAIKKMETEKLIEHCCGNDKRSKELRLTDKGMELAQKTVDKIIDAERKTMNELSDKEQKLFVDIFRKYTDRLCVNFTDLKRSEKRK